MRLPCLIFVILLSILSQTECVLNGDLVEGLDNYKYLVAILARAKGDTESEACGGAILNDRLILTAAHCFAKRSHGDIPDQASLQVIAHTRSNLEMITEGFLLRKVAKIYVHAGYFQTRYDHDIAIIQAVTLPTVNFPTTGKEAVLAGYGAYGFNGNQRLSDGHLRSMNVRVVPDQVLDEMFLSGKPTDDSKPRGFCAGDSGGPLVIRSKSNFGLTTDYTVIGLVKSNKGDCDDRISPGIYTRVSYYLESFINKIMDDPDNIVDDLIKIKEVFDVQSCSND